MKILDGVTANKIRDGDVSAFEELINSHQDRVFNYCLRAVGDYHLAEELAQEVFIKVFRNIDRYDWRKASLSTWIYTITHNTCINNLRNKCTQVGLDKAEMQMACASAEDQYLAVEELNRLAEMLRHLPPEERMLVIMKDYLGFKYRKIGLIIGAPTGTVKSRVHSVRMKIRTWLGDGDD